MPTTTPGLRAATAGLAATGRHIGFLTGGDATTPGAEVSGGTYARQPTTWPTTDTDGDWTGTQVEVQIPAGTTVTGWGLYSAATGGDLLSWARLPANEGFGSAAPYRWTPSLSTTSL